MIRGGKRPLTRNAVRDRLQILWRLFAEVFLHCLNHRADGALASDPSVRKIDAAHASRGGEIQTCGQVEAGDYLGSARNADGDDRSAFRRRVEIRRNERRLDQGLLRLGGDRNELGDLPIAYGEFLSCRVSGFARRRPPQPPCRMSPRH